MYSFLLSISLLISGLTHLHQAPTLKSTRADKTTSTISYHMVHPLHEWTGTNKAVDGVIQYDAKTLQLSKVAIMVKVSGFDSDNSNRDSHMMEVTEAIKYPSISFVSTSLVDKGNQLEVKGNVQFHGVTKEVSFTAIKTLQKNELIVNGGIDILLEDFKLERPSLMMVEVDNKVNIAFQMHFILS